MKLIKLPHSFLLMRINPKKDTAKCLFVFWINWNAWHTDRTEFDLSKTTAAQIKEIYKQLANDWTGKYRV